MSWYAAHLIEYFKLREGVQDTYPVWESVIILQTSSVNEAFKIARQIGEEAHSIADPSWRLDEKPADHIFLGVRKVVECDVDEAETSQNQITSGVEITYTKMQVATEDDLQKLLRGDNVIVTLEEVSRDISLK